MTLIQRITKSLMRWCEKRGRVFNITGTGADHDVYLVRYYVIRSRFFNFWVHQFLRSDRDDLHDHPWNFWTYLVQGSYTETKREFDGIGDYRDVKTVRCNEQRLYAYTSKMTGVDAAGYPIIEMADKRFTPVRLNVWVSRKATDLHKVEVDRPLLFHERDQAPTTLFFSGPTLREWGFVKGDTWIHWKKYLGLSDDAPSRG